MDPMELDLDFSVDKIKDFLNNKLEAVRLDNARLQETLTKRKQISLNSSAKHGSTLVMVHPNVWKKLNNGKYVIGMNLDARAAVMNIRPLLKWDCAEPFNYVTNIYGEFQGAHDVSECALVTNTVARVTTAVEGSLTITITFEIPTCPDPEHVISGAISVRVQNEEIVVPMAPVSLSALDYANRSLQNHNPRLFSIENLFALISASENSDLVMITPENRSMDLGSLFEIHCALTKLEVGSSCKSYYLSYNVSGAFDGSLVSVHDPGEAHTYFITIYAGDNRSLFALLHHLHSCATEIVCFPQTYYENYAARNTLGCEKLLQDFRKSMSDEVKFVREILAGNSVDGFGDKLAALERETDRLYLKVSNMRH
ncbi:uncharacterized protein LOC132698453 [Cylas formicarius]|uniref:uncharacterized protein LOC132698453 n=1 Tax=Cylas formicarius TaxID=197179 RepID=UPI0029586639|nr:uncharacterized protein LOC132698453 [Cylas formicarius]